MFDTENSIIRLHEEANKFGISKSFFNFEPKPHYSIISGVILDNIIHYLDKIESKKK